ncbi:hypothetical protein HN51_035169, partial [Arachis hypogaea]
KVGVPRQLFVTKNPSTIPYEITKAGMKLPLGTYLYFLIEVDTFLDYDNLSKGIVFTTDRPYQPGEQITGWPLDLMAYAYLAVSPPSMIARSEEMAAAASNKSTAKKDLRYPEIEEQALCESRLANRGLFKRDGWLAAVVTAPP